MSPISKSSPPPSSSTSSPRLIHRRRRRRRRRNRNLAAALLFVLVLLAPNHRPAATTTLVEAIYAEDVGRLDFVVETAGHGPRIGHVSSTAVEEKEEGKDEGREAIVVTSDAGGFGGGGGGGTAATTSCVVAGRKVGDGSLVWRRNVCSSGGRRRQWHAVASRRAPSSSALPLLPLLVHTVDGAGSVRAWDASTGALVWERQLPSASGGGGGGRGGGDDDHHHHHHSSPSSIWTFSPGEDEYYVAVEASDAATLAVYDAVTGEEQADAAADRLKKEAKDDAPSSSTDLGTSAACAAFDGVSGLEISLVAPEEAGGGGNGKFTYGPVNGEAGGVGDLKLSGDDEATSLTLLACKSGSASVLVTSKRGTTQQVTFTAEPSGAGVAYEVVWSAEEGLSDTTSATLLDSSHYVGVDLDRESEMHMLKLSTRLQSQWKRLTGLFASLAKIPGSAEGDDSSQGSDDEGDLHSRIHVFGFVKTAALVSQSAARLYGIDTVGRNRGKIRYVVDLPSDGGDGDGDGDTANRRWHRIVHGGISSGTSVPSSSAGADAAVEAVHGEGVVHGGGTQHHGRDVLVLSMLDADGSRQLHWTCLDGASGSVHGSGSLQLASPPAQIVPIGVSTGTTPCRQGAILLLRDGSLVALPKNDGGGADRAIANQLHHVAPNGLYAHAISLDHGSAKLESFLLSLRPSSATDLESELVGSVVFPGEHVVRVAYPKRDEVIQSPCNVLGDDSLLLKYINPHLVVVVTMTSNASDDPESKVLSDVLKAGNSKGASRQQKRKPVGVTAAGGSASDAAAASAAEDDSAPNLFVNVVDSVSGRILYRASHANAVAYPTPPTAVVSENWIFYSFANEKTRRAEIGVLSLYEGMIDSKGLTAFTSPEQSKTFSSMDARESKPVVLAKSYSIAKPVTALGVSSTRSGISSRRLILAGVDGQIYTIDRKSLEPRRPLGELKDSEKKEGLAQYNELIPIIPFLSLTSNRTIESVKGIITAPTDLESQSLVLAYGGQDIFFTRTSPSRGFDLLPDNFNRVMLSLVVAALLAILLVMRQRVLKKFLKQGWS